MAGKPTDNAARSSMSASGQKRTFSDTLSNVRYWGLSGHNQAKSNQSGVFFLRNGEIQGHQNPAEVCLRPCLDPQPLQSGPPPQPPRYLQAVPLCRPGGIVTLIERGTRTMGDRYLCWQRHELPRCIRRNAEQSVVSSRDQVTLEVEVIVDGGVNRQKSLR